MNANKKKVSKYEGKAVQRYEVLHLCSKCALDEKIIESRITQRKTSLIF